MKLFSVSPRPRCITSVHRWPDNHPKTVVLYMDDTRVEIKHVTRKQIEQSDEWWYEIARAMMVLEA